MNTRLKTDDSLVGRLAGCKNRMPAEGINDVVTAYFKGGAGPANLYIGLWSGAHTPNGSETAANLASLVTEVTNYTQATRMLLDLGAVVDGGVSNAAVGTALTANRDTGDNITAKDYAFGFGADFLLGSVAGRFSPEWGKIGMDNMRLPPKTEEQLLREVDDLEKGSLSAAAAPTNTVRPGTTLTPELNGDVPIGAKPAGAPRFSVVGQMATSDESVTTIL